ncbi:unnamed protein product [Notodromas monacha]|uniref:Mitochondrial inner membrane protease subunit n=1 Tax=Notodromas monacha TaxID=399045 RepID=A0A7R9BH12_9CRUS|nr:unnamed protein product [Notodromas monacha]CAG0915313.1 unnamed protein product [Notodromas monacha]
MILQFLKALCVSVPVGLTFVDTVGSIAKVDGTSMQPVLNPKPGCSDYVFLNKWAVRNFELHRGDVVSLRSPREPNVHLIKRVIGLEGDVVTTNGYRRSLVDIPPGHCWLEGDHTGHSVDSNSFGPVSTQFVVLFGKWLPHSFFTLILRVCKTVFILRRLEINRMTDDRQSS